MCTPSVLVLSDDSSGSDLTSERSDTDRSIIGRQWQRFSCEAQQVTGVAFFVVYYGSIVSVSF